MEIDCIIYSFEEIDRIGKFFFFNFNNKIVIYDIFYKNKVSKVVIRRVDSFGRIFVFMFVLFLFVVCVKSCFCKILRLYDLIFE